MTEDGYRHLAAGRHPDAERHPADTISRNDIPRYRQPDRRAKMYAVTV